MFGDTHEEASDYVETFRKTDLCVDKSVIDKFRI